MARKAAGRPLVDRALAAVGLQRAGAVAPTRTRGAFAGAQQSRVLDWVFGWIRSVRQEQDGDLDKLRANARDLVRNTALGTRYLRVLVDRILDPEVGIRLQAQTGDETRNTAIETAWWRWCQPTACTIHGAYSFNDVLERALAGMAADGEAFLVERDLGPFGYQLELVDPDYLDASYTTRLDEGRRVIQGIEVDATGRPLVYWFWRSHPSETGTRERVPIPADRVIHLFRRRRHGQLRGESWFSPVMGLVHTKHAYVEAAVAAARLAAAKVGVIELPEDGVIPEAPITMDGDALSIEYVDPGGKLNKWDSNWPNVQHGDFVASIDGEIAAGLSISYMTLTGNLERASYSSGRLGELLERDFYRRMQQLLITHCCERIYARWLPAAIRTGQVVGVSRTASALEVAGHRWQPRTWPWADPSKELDGAETELRLGITSRTRLAAERGRDFLEVLDELEAEQQAAADRGVTLGAAAPPADSPSDSTSDPAANPARARFPRVA